MQDAMDLLDDHMYVVVISVICLAILSNSLIRALTSIVTTHSKERSRREIAAYVAEGSLSPEQGERLVRADVNADARRRG